MYELIATTYLKCLAIIWYGRGDVFFTFSHGTVNDANATQRLLAVNFASRTDSKTPEVGVYGNVSAKRVG